MAVIVVTGTPGVGKTTFARLLSKRTGLPVLDLNEYIISNELYSSYDKRRGSFVVSLRRARRKFREDFSGWSGIVDSHVSHLVVPKGLVRVCFVLRCSPYVLEERLKSLGRQPSSVKENCAAEVLGTILAEALARYGPSLVHELDATEGAEAVVEEALSVLSGETEPSHGRVDWLSVLAERGDLERWFEG